MATANDRMNVAARSDFTGKIAANAFLCRAAKMGTAPSPLSASARTVGMGCSARSVRYYNSEEDLFIN